MADHRIPGGDGPSDKYENPVLENIYRRRSVRNYRPDPVPDEVLLELVKAGIYAPSATNQQAWRFIVVTDRAQIDRYADRAKRLWQNHIGLRLGALLGVPGLKRYVKMMDAPEFHLFHHAPALVFIFAPKRRLVVEDCSCAAENMMLAARSLGLGSCWIGFAGPLGSDKRTREELKVPKGYRLIATMVFGYPKNENVKAPSRNEDVIINWVG